MRWLVLAVGLALTSACSSSDDTNGTVDAGPDTLYPLCGNSSNSCCCNESGALHPVPCAEDGGPSCPVGYRYIVDECPFHCLVPVPDASIDTRTDAKLDGDTACDAGGYCCCDIDVLVEPTCSVAGPTCPSGYRLLSPSECAAPGSCTLRYDTGTFDGDAPHD